MTDVYGNKAGRSVAPKPLRDQVGMVAGEVEVTVDGSGLHLESIAGDELADEDGRLVIPPAGGRIDDDDVRMRRAAGHR